MKKTGLILLFSIIFATNALAFSVEHSFNVFLGAFNASKTNFTYSLTPNEYDVKSKVKTFGMFDTLYPFTANYRTCGKIKNNNLETTDYSYESKSRFSTRTKKLVYNEDGIPVLRISSKNDKEKKAEIKEDINNEGTTDLQTAIVKLAQQYNQMKFCDSTMDIFDGKRRFNVIFKDEGKENLATSEHSPFSGMATKCSMYIDKLDSTGDDLMWELSSDKPIYFWLLEDAKTKKPFIAQIKINDTPLGELNVYTDKIIIKE